MQRATSPSGSTESRPTKAGSAAWERGQLQNLDRAFRQRFQESAAISLGHDPVVEDHDDASVALVRIKRPTPWRNLRIASGSEYSVKASPPRAWMSSSLASIRGMIRHREGQPGEDDVGERFARHVHSHPETVPCRRGHSAGCF